MNAGKGHRRGHFSDIRVSQTQCASSENRGTEPDLTANCCASRRAHDSAKRCPREDGDNDRDDQSQAAKQKSCCVVTVGLHHSILRL